MADGDPSTAWPEEGASNPDARIEDMVKRTWQNWGDILNMLDQMDPAQGR